MSKAPRKTPNAEAASRTGGRFASLKIGPKIVAGFAAVLALTAVVGFVGWKSLGQIVSQVDTSEVTTQLVTVLGDVRDDVKTYQLSPTAKAEADVVSRLASLRSEADELRQHMDTDAERAMSGRVVDAIAGYEAAFKEYSDLQDSKASALASMKENAEAFRAAASEIEAGQKAEYRDLQDEVRTLDEQRQETAATVADAETLIASVKDARRVEKDFLLTDDDIHVHEVRRLISRVTELGNSMMARFTDEEAKLQVAELTKVAGAYLTGFESLVELKIEARDAQLQNDIALSNLDRASRIIAGKIKEMKKTVGGQADPGLKPDVDRLGTLLAEMRFAEKNFLLTGESADAEEVLARNADLAALAADLKPRAGGGDFLELIESVEERAKEIAADFKTVAENRTLRRTADEKAEEALGDMVNNAREFESIAIRFTMDQQEMGDEISEKTGVARLNMMAKLGLSEEASKLIRFVEQAAGYEKDYLLNVSEETAGAFDNAIMQILSVSTGLQERVRDPDLKDRIAAMRDMATKYQEEFARVVDLTARQTAADKKMAAAAETVIGIVSTARDQQKAAMANEKNSANLILASGTAVALLIGLLFAVLISRGISRPIRSMTGAMQRLAQGDLEAEVPARGRGDEIGEMAGAVQIFKNNAQEKVRLEAEQAEKEKQAEAEKRKAMLALADSFEASVGRVVNEVSSASAEMTASSETMTSTAERTASQSAAVAGASEQASANVETVSAAAEELSASIAEIGRQVGQASDVAKSAVTEAQATNAQIKNLAEAADRIGEVVALITDIADQTNLLALNATIEAARAGDAGKGFAVVASEVKNLANQTAKATDEIASQVADIQQSTTKAVGAIEGITKTILQIDEVNSGIASAVEQQSAATQEIARNVEQAAVGTTEVNSHIASVSQAANDTGAAAEQIRSASLDLSKQSETLRAEVAKFLASVRAT